MIEKITLDQLTQDSVSLKKQQYIMQDGKECTIGEPWRCAYINSINGRLQVENEVEEPYKSEIMSTWGDSPTIVVELPEPNLSSTQQIQELKYQLAETDYKIIKCYEYNLAGLDLPYDIEELHTERQALRDKINELETD